MYLEPEEIKKSHQLWDQYIRDRMDDVQSLKLPRLSGESSCTIAMIEPRKHPHLGFVIRNALRYLGPGWDLDIFIGNQNRTFVEEALSGLGSVRTHQLDVEDLTPAEYNYLKKLPKTWEAIQAENILWLEPDCIVCRQGIEDYMEYDFIGAPWHEDFMLSPSIRVGNGGLSFRKRQAMLDISRNANPDMDVFYPEDVFYVMNMHMSNSHSESIFKLPDYETARSFAVEGVFHPEPFGLHKIWKYLPYQQVKCLLERAE